MIGLNGQDAPVTAPPNPVTREEAVKHALTEEAKARANSDPLPGPIADAFDERGYIKVGEYEVRPIVAYDFVLMKQCKMAMHEFILELAKSPELREEIEWTDEEQWTLAWMFTRPCADVRKVFRQGREALYETAFNEIACKLHPIALNKIIEAVQLQFGKSVITAVEYGGGDEGKPQLFQDAGAMPPMGSAGGQAT